MDGANFLEKLLDGGVFTAQNLIRPRSFQNIYSILLKPLI